MFWRAVKQKSNQSFGLKAQYCTTCLWQLCTCMARSYRSITVGCHEFSERGVPLDLKVYHTTILSCDLQVDVFRSILKHLNRDSDVTPWAFSRDDKMDVSGMRFVILYNSRAISLPHCLMLLLVLLWEQRRLGETARFAQGFAVCLSDKHHPFYMRRLI